MPSIPMDGIADEERHTPDVLYNVATTSPFPDSDPQSVVSHSHPGSTMSRKAAQGKWLYQSSHWTVGDRPWNTAQRTLYAEMITRIYNLVLKRSDTPSDGAVGINPLHIDNTGYTRYDTSKGNPHKADDDPWGTKYLYQAYNAVRGNPSDFRLPWRTPGDLAALAGDVGARGNILITEEHIAAIVHPLLAICDVEQFLYTSWCKAPSSKTMATESRGTLAKVSDTWTKSGGTVTWSTNGGSPIAHAAHGAGGDYWKRIPPNFNYDFVNGVVTELEQQNDMKNTYLPSDVKNPFYFPTMPQQMYDWIRSGALIVVNGYVVPTVGGMPMAGNSWTIWDARDGGNTPYTCWESIWIGGVQYPCNINSYRRRHYWKARGGGNMVRVPFYQRVANAHYTCRGACTGLCHGACSGACIGCESTCTGFCDSSANRPVDDAGNIVTRADQQPSKTQWTVDGIYSIPGRDDGALPYNI